MDYVRDLRSSKRAEVIRVLKRSVKLLESDAFFDSDFDFHGPESRVSSYLSAKLEYINAIIAKE